MTQGNDIRYEKFLEDIREAASSMANQPSRTEADVLRKIHSGMKDGTGEDRTTGIKAKAIISMAASAAAVFAIAVMTHTGTPDTQSTVVAEASDRTGNEIKLYSAYKTSRILKDKILQKISTAGEAAGTDENQL